MRYTKMVVLILVALTACSRLDQMNDEMQRSNQMIASNTQAIEKSTTTMQESNAHMQKMTGFLSKTSFPLAAFLLFFLPLFVLAYLLFRLDRKLAKLLKR